MSKYRYNGKGVAPTDFSVAPAGRYPLLITDVKEKENKHGLPSYRVSSVIDDISGLRKRVNFNVNILPSDNKGAGIAVHFLKTIGEPWEGEFDIDPDNWIGRRFIGTVTIRKNENNGEDYNDVKGVAPVEDGRIFDVMTKEAWLLSKEENNNVPF